MSNLSRLYSSGETAIGVIVDSKHQVSGLLQLFLRTYKYADAHPLRIDTIQLMHPIDACG